MVDTDGTHLCVECEGCPRGQGLSHECGNRVSADAMVKCVPCQPGANFSSEHDTSSCVPCASCSEDQVVLQNCTPTMNVKCRKECYSMDRYNQMAFTHKILKVKAGLFCSFLFLVCLFFIINAIEMGYSTQYVSTKD